MKNAMKISSAPSSTQRPRPLAPALQAEAELVALAQVAHSSTLEAPLGGILTLLSDATLSWAAQSAGSDEAPTATTHGLDAFCRLGEVVAGAEIGFGSLALLEQCRRRLLSINPHVPAEEFSLDDALWVLLSDFALPAVVPDHNEVPVDDRALLLAVEPLKASFRVRMGQNVR